MSAVEHVKLVHQKYPTMWAGCGEVRTRPLCGCRSALCMAPCMALCMANCSIHAEFLTAVCSSSAFLPSRRPDQPRDGPRPRDSSTGSPCDVPNLRILPRKRADHPGAPQFVQVRELGDDGRLAGPVNKCASGLAGLDIPAVSLRYLEALLGSGQQQLAIGI